MLDWWFAKFPEGRGAIFTTIPAQRLVASRCKGSQSSLPKFYKNALRYLREIKMVPVKPGEFLHPNEAWAEPLWTSPRIDLSNPNFRDTWHHELHTRTIGDMIDPFTGNPYTIRKVKSRIRQALRVEGEYIIGRGARDIMGFRQRSYTPVSRLITQWSSFLRDVGEETLHYAAAEEGENPMQVRGYSQVALKLMRDMGWQVGEGLGSRGEGITEPHLPKGQTSRAGLGLTTVRHSSAAGGREQKHHGIFGFKAENGETVYGLKGERNGQQVLVRASKVHRERCSPHTIGCIS